MEGGRDTARQKRTPPPRALKASPSSRSFPPGPSSLRPALRPCVPSPRVPPRLPTHVPPRLPLLPPPPRLSPSALPPLIPSPLPPPSGTPVPLGGRRRGRGHLATLRRRPPTSDTRTIPPPPPADFIQLRARRVAVTAPSPRASRGEGRAADGRGRGGQGGAGRRARSLSPRWTPDPHSGGNMGRACAYTMRGMARACTDTMKEGGSCGPASRSAGQRFRDPPSRHASRTAPAGEE